VIYVTKSIPQSVLALAKPLGFSVAFELEASKFSSTGGAASYGWGSSTDPYSGGISISGNGIIPDGPIPFHNTDVKTGLEIDLAGAVSLNLTEYGFEYSYWALPK
jgi:hypothetical protein